MSVPMSDSVSGFVTDPTNPTDPADPADASANAPAHPDDPLRDRTPPTTPPPAASDAKDEVEATEPGPYAARRGSFYINVRYGLSVVAILMGCWFLYDGFVKYPAQNEEFDRLTAASEEAQLLGREEEAEAYQGELKEKGLNERHSDLSINFQKILGIGLPPLAILLLIRWLYISRGEVKLNEQDVLHHPGHPLVKADEITEIDDELWDRKGISYMTYATASGETGTIKLDDFLYEREPIDKIHDRILYLKSQREEAV